MTNRILFVGESWASYAVHTKGLASYTTSSYEEGADALLDVLGDAGFDVTYVRNHEATETLPYTVEEYEDTYDAIIISDAPSDEFLLPKAVFTDGLRRPNRLASIRDFASRGGGLLMIGGYMSFSGFEARARFGMTPLAAALPVTMMATDDRIETPEGAVPTRRGAHPVTEGLPEDWPYFLGYNRVAAAEGAQTLLSFGADPLLVVGSYGEGRTAAFTSDCSPHWGSPAFMEWDGYAPLWNQLTTWLSTR